MSKLDPKSLKCIVLSYSRVQKGYRCYCSNLRRYLVLVDINFLENVPFSSPPTYTNQGEEVNLLVYTFASLIVSPDLTLVPTPVKPLITQVYTRSQHPPVSSPPPVASTSNPILSDDLSIAIFKGKCQCAHPISSFFFHDHLSLHSYSFIASLDSILLPNMVSKALAHPGWRSAMKEEIFL